MKNILEFLIFTLAVIGIPIGAMLLVEALVKLITIEMIVNFSYAILAIGSIFIIKDIKEG